ncbi:STAS domain-containing protein [Paractinoplanes rishiriensis]|nr:STAS domain-containing protein [Actinoplanes rishiriensis]
MAIAIEPQGAIGAEADAELLQDRFIMVLAATHPERIVLDLSAVPSISEAGIGALVNGFDLAAASDASVTVVQPERQVREQLQRRGLDVLVDHDRSRKV